MARAGRERAVGTAYALLAAAGLGAGNELTAGGDRPGFVVGSGDHVVLAPYGIHAADPEAFAGDWFTAAAPQPHWLFDVVVWAGRSIGHLPGVLLAYYLFALLVFGAATALLARRWGSLNGRTGPWVGAVASLAVGLLSAYQAVYLAGTNTLNSPLALPNVLGGALTYLFLAALACRRRWAPVVLPAAAAAHIQMGVLALGAGALVWCYDAWRVWRSGALRRGVARRVLLVPAAWWVLGLVVALAGMRARAVASDPAAFVEICNRYIPFHCAARSWSLWQMLSTAAAAALAVLVATLCVGRDRWRYLLAVGVPAVGLVLAMAADRRGVPVLGRAVQAYNAYRVGNLVFPFAVWGVLVPFLPAARGGCGAVVTSADREDRGGAAAVGVAPPDGHQMPPSGARELRRCGDRRLALALVFAPLTVVFFTSPGVASGMKTGFVAGRRPTPAMVVALVVLVLLMVGVWAVRRSAVPSGERRPVGASAAGEGADAHAANPIRPLRVDTAGAAGAAGMGALVLAGLLLVRAAGFTGSAPAPLQWPASGAARDWGAAARSLIPPDSQVVIAPVLPDLKLALERGVVVDCKDLPYGGAAYVEWKDRLGALGGATQCETYAPTTYGALTGAQLDAAARRYGARAIVVAHRDGANPQAGQLEALGYRRTHVDGGTPALDTDVLTR